MDKPVQPTEQWPINAYLSYRCKNDRDVKARDELEKLCDDYNITLVYDQKVTEEGDSLIEFMDDLSAARCVFIFLSPEYFQSAYTLFELICMHERADLDERFILPVRLSEAMVTYQWTATKNYFVENEHVRNELTRLLNVCGINHDNLWERIDDAWNASIFPYLDTLSVSMEKDEDGKKLNEFVQETHKKINADIHDSKKILSNTITKEVTSILNKKTIDLGKLRNELKMTPHSNELSISEKLVELTPVNDGIIFLYRVVEAQKKQLRVKSKKWTEVFFDAEQLIGWLLLSTVNPIWWFHNKINLQPSANSRISGSVNGTNTAYIEVIIARGALQPAQFSLTDIGGVKAGIKKNNNGTDSTILFDGISKGAVDEVLLTAIYKDLHHNPPDVPKEWEDLLDGIQQRAEIHFEVRRSKFVYYLVTQEYLNLLTTRDWFPNFQQRLAPYLKFICCDQTAKPGEKEACIERESKLLSTVALFLSLDK